MALLFDCIQVRQYFECMFVLINNKNLRASTDVCSAIRIILDTLPKSSSSL